RTISICLPLPYHASTLHLILYYSVSLLSDAFPVFFFYCSAAHPDLHSFPTRRSSDLSITSRSDCSAVVRSTGSSSRRRLTTRNRSEEHTSELQSRFDLVCRLLLEKKKKQQR